MPSAYQKERKQEIPHSFNLSNRKAFNKSQDAGCL